MHTVMNIAETRMPDYVSGMNGLLVIGMMAMTLTATVVRGRYSHGIDRR